MSPVIMQPAMQPTVVVQPAATVQPTALDPLIVKIGRSEHYIGSPPSPQQWEFINSSAPEQLYGGAKRGGKSVAGSQKLICLAVAFPGNRLGMFRQDLTDLRESVLETFFRICPEELILDHHQTHRDITIRTNGRPSVIHYGGLRDVKVEAGHKEESAKGQEYGEFYIDEPSEIDVANYRMLRAQLCWILPNGQRPPYMAMLGCNPEPGWVYDRFADLIDPTENDPKKKVVYALDRSRVFIKALPRDNIYLPPNWERDQEFDAPKEWVDKYLKGSWKVSTGQVFKEFDCRRWHGVPLLSDIPPDYLKTLRLLGSLDHATTGVTCFAIDGVDADGNIIALASYYQKNRLVSDHAKEIRRLADFVCRACGKPIDNYAGRTFGQHPAFDFFEYVLIDPSTQAKTQTSGNELMSIQDLYYREGIPTLAAINTMESGILLMSEYIHVKPTHIHPWRGERPSPSFFVVEEFNRDGIREIEGWKKTISDRGQIKYVGPDHWIDNQRYIIASRPEPPRFTIKDRLAMDVHARQAQRALDRFDKKFGRPPNPAQWFPGGTSGAETWFPAKID